MNLTPEDIAVFCRIAPELSACVEGDGIDYRVILAREETYRKFAGCYERPGQWVTRRAKW